MAHPQQLISLHSPRRRSSNPSSRRQAASSTRSRRTTSLTMNGTSASPSKPPEPPTTLAAGSRELKSERNKGGTPTTAAASVPHTKTRSRVSIVLPPSTSPKKKSPSRRRGSNELGMMKADVIATDDKCNIVVCVLPFDTVDDVALVTDDVLRVTKAAGGLWTKHIVEGDQIVAFNGHAVLNRDSLAKHMAKATDSVTVVVRRKHGIAAERVKLATRQTGFDYFLVVLAWRRVGPSPKLGLAIRHCSTKKVIVSRTDDKSMAAMVFMEGDRIIEVEGEAMTDRDVTKALIIDRLLQGCVTMQVERAHDENALEQMRHELDGGSPNELPTIATPSSLGADLPTDIQTILRAEQERRKAAPRPPLTAGILRSQYFCRKSKESPMREKGEQVSSSTISRRRCSSKQRRGMSEMTAEASTRTMSSVGGGGAKEPLYTASTSTDTSSKMSSAAAASAYKQPSNMKVASWRAKKTLAKPFQKLTNKRQVKIKRGHEVVDIKSDAVGGKRLITLGKRHS